MVAAADGAAGVEELEVMAADTPRTLFLRCHHADPNAYEPAAYDLAITEVDLETIEGDRIRPLDEAFRLDLSLASGRDAPAIDEILLDAEM